jgi:hypothetical protein
MHRLMLLALAVALTACGAGPDSPTLPTLAPTLPPVPDPITFDAPTTGTLSDDNPSDEYRFFGEADVIIDVQVTEGTIGFALLNADRTPVLTALTGPFALPTDANYILQVTGEPGSYVFTLSGTSPTPVPPTATRTPLPVVVAIPTNTPAPLSDLGTFQRAITSANPAFGAFNTPDERHVYSFQGAASLYVRLRMQRTSGTVDPILTLYAPDGTAIATDDNGGGGRTALIGNVQLPTDGVYSVLASGDGFVGTYEITLETAPEAYPVTPSVDGSGQVAAQPTQAPIVLTPTLAPGVTGGLLLDHAVTEGNIDRAGGFDRFSIAVSAGEVFSLGVLPDEGVQLRVDLINPNGSVAAAVEQPAADGELLISGFTPTLTGTYIAFVTDTGDTTGDYRISYGRGTTREDVRQGETFPDRQYSSEVARRAVRDVWFLRLNAGDLLTASVTRTAGTLDPVLEFVGPDGAVLFTADNATGATSAEIPTVRAPSNGLYQLRVRGTQANQLGAYSLVWRYIEAAPTPTPPLLVADLFAVDDTLPEQAFLYYPFQGYAGERVLIEVEAAPGSGLDAIVALLNEQGEAFAEDDDGGGNLNPRLLAQIPEDGIYQVRVGGYLSGGGFILRVKRVY